MVLLVTLLILINSVLLIAIGLIRQENPFDVWVLLLLAMGNVVAFLLGAIITHDAPMRALASLGTNLLPVIVAVGGVVLLFFLLAVFRHRENSSS